MNHLDVFYRLSSMLTGYQVVVLQGTGVGDEYYEVLTEIVSPEIIDDLFDTYSDICLSFPLELDPDFHDEVRSRILANEKLGPVARNIIKMWYLSIWYQLPPKWRTTHGSPTQAHRKYQDVDFIVSENAYIQGFVWQAVGSHPMGAKQPGYSTWSLPPSTNQVIIIEQ